jgi:hypothetical protein
MEALVPRTFKLKAVKASQAVPDADEIAADPSSGIGLLTGGDFATLLYRRKSPEDYLFSHDPNRIGFSATDRRKA